MKSVSQNVNGIGDEGEEWKNARKLGSRIELNQVKTEIGQRDVFFQNRAMARPFRVALAKDECVVGQTKDVLQMRVGSHRRGSHVVDFIGQPIERRVPIDLVGHRVEEHRLVVGFAGSDGRRRHHPDGDAFCRRV